MSRKVSCKDFFHIIQISHLSVSLNLCEQLSVYCHVFIFLRAKWHENHNIKRVLMSLETRFCKYGNYFQLQKTHILSLIYLFSFFYRWFNIGYICISSCWICNWFPFKNCVGFFTLNLFNALPLPVGDAMVTIQIDENIFLPQNLHMFLIIFCSWIFFFISTGIAFNLTLICMNSYKCLLQ